MPNYTEEEVKDIQDREKLCLDFLKDNQMTPAASIQKVNMGKDVFGDKLIPFLRDMKFNQPESQPSPIQREDLNDESSKKA